MPKELLIEAMELFRVPSTRDNEASMMLYIYNQISKMDGVSFEIDNWGNMKIVKGIGPYPCFCAHLDTVHTYYDGFNVCYDGECLFAKNEKGYRVGVGGDDKCGIFVCLYLLQRMENIKIVFFSREETGGTGSNNIDLGFFSDCKFLGGIDRWNGHDFVDHYSGVYTTSKKFEDATKEILHRYNLTSAYGMFTDSFNVMERGVGISCFNISCGYYQHHTNDEYVDTLELYNCCLVCKELAGLPDVYAYKVNIVATEGLYYKNGTKWNTYGKTNTNTKTKVKTYAGTKDRYCIECGMILNELEDERCIFCEREYKEARRQAGFLDPEEFE